MQQKVEAEVHPLDLVSQNGSHLSSSDQVPHGDKSKARAARLRAYAYLSPLFLILILWLWLFYGEGAFHGGPNGKAFEADFAMFYTAAQIQKEGGNLYDAHLLYRTEQTMLARDHIPITPLQGIVRVGNPPLLYWAMRPLTRFPFQPAAYFWLGLLSCFSLIGFFGLLRYLGWKRWFLPTLMFALMPQVVFGPFYGNIVCLVFAGIGVGLALLRKYPFLAGTFLVLAWLKPPVALPTVAIILLFHGRERVRAATGFAVATVAFFGLTALLTGWNSLMTWAIGLGGYSRSIHMSPDVASLAGLYVRLVPDIPRSALQGLCIALAAGLTAFWGWKHRATQEPPLLVFAWLPFLWFLAAPYAHFFDEVLLTLPVLLLMGRDAKRASWRWSVRVLYLLVLSLTVISANPYQVQLLSLPLLLAAICILFADLNPRYREA